MRGRGFGAEEGLNLQNLRPRAWLALTQEKTAV